VMVMVMVARMGLRGPLNFKEEEILNFI